MGLLTKVKKYKWLLPLIMKSPSEDRKNLLEGFKKRKQYYTKEGIDANLKEMVKCSLCPNMCRFDCPALLASKRETYSPANKVRIGYFMGMGKVPINNPSAITALYACMNCDACQHWCPMDISAGDHLTEMRAELDKHNLIPEKYAHLKARVTSNGSIFEENPFSKAPEFDIKTTNPEIFYFIGCMNLKYRPSTVNATIAILKSLEIPFSTCITNRQCCGSPLLEAGYKSVASELASKNAIIITETKAPLIISDCPGCVYMLNHSYKELGYKLPKTIHTSEYFLDLIQKGKIKFQTELKKVITVHDPCVLARKIGKPNDLEHIIRNIPGMKLEEAYLRGEETQCCGYGGNYHISFETESNQIGEKRLNQLRKFNPDFIVSGCPTCEYALQKAQKIKPSIENKAETIVNITEMIAQSMGLKF